jgi:nucleoside-diphosphate-sugar epimerase
MTTDFSRQGRIVVTGASGWVGRTVLDMLTQLLDKTNAKQQLRAYGSQKGTIKLMSGEEVSIESLTELPLLGANEPISFIFHCAFLTPDHYASLGHNDYNKINREISNSVAHAIETCPSPPRVVAFSSGAATLFEKQGGQTLSRAIKLYGQLKSEEENRLRSLAHTLVLRIYALSGRYIRNPRRYALGDFIYHAHHGKRIEFKSKRPVIRGYAHADTIVALAIQWLLSKTEAPSQPISTISHIIELRELANLICQIYDQPAPAAEAFCDFNADYYADTSSPFLGLLDKYGIIPSSLEEQISDTSKAFAESAN